MIEDGKPIGTVHFTSSHDDEPWGDLWVDWDDCPPGWEPLSAGRESGESWIAWRQVTPPQDPQGVAT